MTDYSTAICRSYRTILHVMMLFVIIKQANMGKMLRIITIINFVIVIIPIIMLLIFGRTLIGHPQICQMVQYPNSQINEAGQRFSFQ